MPTHFIVSRINWRPAGRSGTLVRLPGEVRAAAFPASASAEADARRREGEARGKVNPFRCGMTWADRSHLPEPVFRDFLHDAGIEPPEPGPAPPKKNRRKSQETPPPGPPVTDWAGWWDAHAAELSDAQRARVWEGLDRVRFFRVEERPVRPVVFAVVRVNWNYNDMWYYPGDEGGEVTVAFRSRERAEAECGRRNDEARARWRQDLGLAGPEELDNPGIDPDRLYQFDMQARPFPDQDPFDPPRSPPERAQEDANKSLFTVDEVPFFEVVELEIGEGA